MGVRAASSNKLESSSSLGDLDGAVGRRKNEQHKACNQQKGEEKRENCRKRNSSSSSSSRHVLLVGVCSPREKELRELLR